jgi:hypothetical protein
MKFNEEDFSRFKLLHIDIALWDLEQIFKSNVHELKIYR